MRLFIEGHNHRRGYVVSRSWPNVEIAAAIASGEVMDDNEPERLRPVRFIAGRRQAVRLVERFNRRFGR